ncbi:2Fe-2S iron-sulfur cluster binding domain-containing protein [Bacillus sp. V3B]|uniref:2Fe-2S iron-sulfur cluster-binding protein n=1 Tax=Bacillus sp. V3B TaxID=2804915 RepID=UPI00210BE740|nr:2Fe-2S iron-sulfur cluster binding domain-containing protein [Bacillus sp. V3B]MCQ6275475.1 2Fe-2S iron-sulfur cluster binding domain-containing protein [Bacillus sp. V3B]
MYKVTLKARGQQFGYSCPPNVTPLRAARDQFIPIPTGCQQGGCGMCKVKVLDGQYAQELVRSHEVLSNEELKNGYALACCMTPKGDLDIITVEDYEKRQNESNAVKLAETK